MLRSVSAWIVNVGLTPLAPCPSGCRPGCASGRCCPPRHRRNPQPRRYAGPPRARSPTARPTPSVLECSTCALGYPLVVGALEPRDAALRTREIPEHTGYLRESAHGAAHEILGRGPVQIDAAQRRRPSRCRRTRRARPPARSRGGSEPRLPAPVFRLKNCNERSHRTSADHAESIRCSHTGSPSRTLSGLPVRP